MVFCEVDFVLQQRVQVRVDKLYNYAYVHQVIVLLVFSAFLFGGCYLGAYDLKQFWNKRAFVFLAPL